MNVLNLRQGDGTWSSVPAIVGPQGKSAYQVAIKNGFTGTEQEWLASLKGADGTMTFEELTPEQKESLKGDKGDPGNPGPKGENGENNIYVGSEEPQDTPALVWINPDGAPSTGTVTEAQVSAMIQEALSQITNANGVEY